MEHDYSPIDGLKVVYRNVAEIRANPANPRQHTKQQIDRIIRAIKEYRWTLPILVDENGVILAGNGRFYAALKMRLIQVPTITVSHLSEVQKKGYGILDNRLTEVAGDWDKQRLARELQAIQLLDPDIDLSTTAFEIDDAQALIDGLLSFDDEEASEPDRSGPAISRLGDLWQLGEHRLYCGSALDRSSFEALLQGELAQMVIVDAPYNVKIDGNCVGKGKHREFVMASGEMSRTEFAQFLTTAFGHLIEFSEDGSMHFLFMDWRHMAEMVLATSQYTEQKNLVVWDKITAGLGACYKSQYELVWVMKSGEAKHINNFQMGQNGRNRSNLWSYQGLNGPAAGRQELLALHPTVKPLALIADAILDCSRKGGLILDCFAGSGTIFLAAEQTGRRAAAIELDPLFVDVAIRRWERSTGRQAVLAHDGRTFDQLEQEGR